MSLGILPASRLFKHVRLELNITKILRCYDLEQREKSSDREIPVAAASEQKLCKQLKDHILQFSPRRDRMLSIEVRQEYAQEAEVHRCGRVIESLLSCLEIEGRLEKVTARWIIRIEWSLCHGPLW